MPLVPALGSIRPAATNSAPLRSISSAMAATARWPHSISLPLPNGHRYAYGDATCATPSRSGSTRCGGAGMAGAVGGAIARDAPAVRDSTRLPRELDRVLVRVGAGHGKKYTTI